MMSPPVNSNPTPGTGVTTGTLLRGNDLPRLECTLLLAHALNATRESVLAHPETKLSDEAAAEFASLLRRRLAGEPIAYLVGSREFYGLNLRITPDVLIPRPATELLVEAALRRLPEAMPGFVLDLGAGSGAVAIAIGKYRPRMEIEALDVADAAVELAAVNARMLSVPNARFHQSDWFSACYRRFYDVIVSNPPYIPSADPHLSEGDLRFEPRIALTPGEDGLFAIRRIVAGAASRLAPDGWLLFEHGYDQAEPCRELMAEAGFVEIATLRDLAGIERVCEGRKRAGTGKCDF
jgi:release factor glutamine methyltransferase